MPALSRTEPGPPAPLMAATNVTREKAIGEAVEWAGDSASRRRGLLGRSGLEPGQGLYIVPCCWIHTFGMKFAIDVAYLDRNGRIVAIRENVAPNRLSLPALGAEGALELPAFTLRNTGTRVGDVIELVRID